MRTNNFKASSKLNSLISFKRGPLKGIKPIAIFFLTGVIVAFLSGCDPSGSVGGGFAGSETDIRYDTTLVGEFNIDTLVAYTGNLDFFSAGQFQDPLFGDITATGLFKPPLASNRDSLAFDDSTSVFLNLAINSKTVYGDSLAPQKFSLYEAQELWRGNQWRVNETMQIGSTPLATFTVGSMDTVETIPLPDSWIAKYGQYFNSSDDSRDSSYVREFYGMVMVPQNYGSVVTVNPFAGTMLATNVKVVRPDSVVITVPRLDSLTIQLGNGEWAYSLQRSNSTPSPQSSSKLISTYERIIRFEHDFNFENIKLRNIIKVEIIFYVDKLLLEQSISQAGAAAVRPESTILNLHYMEGDELPQALSQYNQKQRLLEYVKATYSEKDNAYHFNVTQQVKTGFFELTKDKRDFYITVGKNDGVLRSELLFNSLATGKAPKVVVTYVETDN